MSRAEHSYFFLSYADAGPISDGEAPESDPSVSGFFRDLSEAVQSRASNTGSMAVGFFDQEIPAGVDRGAALEQALGAAEVFVALYSPRYFSRSAPMRELRLFQERLTRAAASNPECHVVPVLWTPLAPGKEYPDLQRAKSLGQGSADYLDNGLRALRTLSLLRESYVQITERLARQIVDCAELNAIGPSPTAPVEFGPQIADSEVQLAIGVLAAEPAWDWRPFEQRPELSVRQAASTAERLGTATKVGDLAEMKQLFQERPALLLIDPWLFHADGGRQFLTSAFAALPKWVVPVIVADSWHAPEVTDAAGQVVTLLQNAGLPGGQPVRWAEEFVDIMPQAVTRARRRFLDLTTRQSGFTGPSLRDQGEPAADTKGMSR